jgi:hypothetical protein
MIRLMLFIATVLFLFSSTTMAKQKTSLIPSGCGAVVTIATHDNTTTRYALSFPVKMAEKTEPAVLLLLPGGSGYLDLDDAGCARSLRGNYLVRSIALFNYAGFITALVDAPSDHHSDDGLAGFRQSPLHADDLGRVITDLRARTKSPVWVLGTSRGTISAVNAVTKLSGKSAPDGIILTSALMSGQSSARKPWVGQTVFDLPLEKIKIPLLVVGHKEDSCVRSPAGLMNDIIDRTKGVRQQVVTVTGGPGASGPISAAACEGRSPHGFIKQENEIVEGIARFIRNSRY